MEEQTRVHETRLGQAGQAKYQERGGKGRGRRRCRRKSVRNWSQLQKGSVEEGFDSSILFGNLKPNYIAFQKKNCPGRLEKLWRCHIKLCCYHLAGPNIYNLSKARRGNKVLKSHPPQNQTSTLFTRDITRCSMEPLTTGVRGNGDCKVRAIYGTVPVSILDKARSKRQKEKPSGQDPPCRSLLFVPYK